MLISPVCAADAAMLTPHACAMPALPLYAAFSPLLADALQFDSRY